MRNIAFLLSCLFLGTFTQVEAQSDASGPQDSSMKITDPNSTTVWTLPNPVEMEWSTSNIDQDKSIRFFLVKGETVVQELGIFKNTQSISGVDLRRGLQSGDTYKVMGIELNPENKYHVAKFATPFFSIYKPPRIIKPKVEVAVVETIAAAVVEAPKEIIPERVQFQGRDISYIKELAVVGEDIQINLWDHSRVDGDIVSIYLNGEAVVTKYHLTYDKKRFDVKLDASKPNDLFLYAHNLGKFPPNTVSIEITDGTNSENIILNSDLKSCEAVLITVNK